MLTTVAKKVQSRLSRKGVKVVLGDIKTQCELMISDIENPTETELLAVQEHFMNNATTLTVVNETVEELSTSVDSVDGIETAGDDLAIATSDNQEETSICVGVATCNYKCPNLQSRDFQTRIKCNYNYTSTRINCN